MITCREEAVQVSQRILEILGHPFTHQGVELHSSASIGVAIYPNDGTDPEELIKNADLAMYRAKHLGRNNCQLFSTDKDCSTRRRLSPKGKRRKADAIRCEELDSYEPEQDSLTAKTHRCARS